MAWTVKKIWAPAVKSRKATIAIKFVFRLPNSVKLFFSVITLPFRLDRIRLLSPDAQARLVQQRCCMKYDYSVPRHAAHAGWLLPVEAWRRFREIRSYEGRVGKEGVSSGSCRGTQ